METDPGPPVRLWQIGVTSGLTGIWTILGVALFAAAAAVAASVEMALHPDWRSVSPTFAGVSIVLSLPLTFIAHEAIHGFAFRAFGGRPRFGAGFTYGMPYFYAACPGQLFSRDRFLIVGAAPLLVLDAAGLLLMLPAATAFFGAGLLAFNTSGAIGDLWAIAMILQAPRWVEIEDTGPTFIAWAAAQHADEAAKLSPPRGLEIRSGRWLTVWFAITLVTSVLCSGVLGFLIRGGVNTVRLGPVVLASHRELNVTAELLLAGAIAVPVTVLVAAAARWLRRRRAS